MAALHDARQIVIAGASSLLGAELKALLEESRFAASDLHLVDEELAAGTLTEAGGEAAVIQTVDEDTFKRASLIFFTGSAAFTQANLDLARHSGAIIIDLSGATLSAGSSPWLTDSGAATSVAAGNSAIYFIPSAAAEAIAKLALALAPLGLPRLTAVAFQPVSGAGKAGVEELESQASQLLSFQPVGKRLFDAQIAFNMLDRFGPQSLYRLDHVTDRVRAEIQAVVRGRAPMPEVQVLHAPVFYGATVSACAKLPPDARLEAITSACKSAGFLITADADSPNCVSVAGESRLHLAPPLPDSAAAGAWWFWCAADNIRLPASNAVKLAEKLIA